ncbi:MAG: GTP-binding protein [Oscillospiraceae bacterium]|nr:GTP-binding protein [Oscillospiraceae bacterium]
MKTKLYLIAGFLGAGKTTLIQKLLQEAFSARQVVLLENDFGETSVDAALLKSDGIKVKELTSGCICCSLSGDFIQVLLAVLRDFQPQDILIEPSGVARLSDLIQSCQDPRIQPLAELAAAVTVVDVSRCQMYLDNFGDFYEDQIAHADAIVFSRVEAHPEKLEAAASLVRKLNPDASLWSSPWAELSAIRLLRPGESAAASLPRTAAESSAPDHEHHHEAEEEFETLTLTVSVACHPASLRRQLNLLADGCCGTVLRAKGLVPEPGGDYLLVQYVPGDARVTRSTIAGHTLTIIGRQLDRPALASLFGAV